MDYDFGAYVLKIELIRDERLTQQHDNPTSGVVLSEIHVALSRAAVRITL